jgi:hypothetical protein
MKDKRKLKEIERLKKERGTGRVKVKQE